MGQQRNGSLYAYLPLVLAATFAVVVVPMLLVAWLRESGHVSSVWAGAAIGVAISLGVSQAGAALWKSRSESDLLFSELMVWGWIQRWRSERQMAKATDLLGLSIGRPEAVSSRHLDSAEKTRLLTQLSTSLESADPYTHGHSKRVARHAANIARGMGLSRDEIAKIRAAGAMHDVGKVETPTSVLHKAGKLTDEEYAIVKQHPVDGAAMVASLEDDELTAIVRHHHERLDGTGYPDGLVGDDIPLGARILAVADTFDAITSTRPYRHANAHKKALDILTAEAGTQLDPDAVRAFVKSYSGRRPLALWTALANGRPKLASLLGDGVSPAGASNMVATAATAAAVGAMASAPLAIATPEEKRTAPAGASASSNATSPSAPARERRDGAKLMASFREAQRAEKAKRRRTREGADGTETSAPVKGGRGGTNTPRADEPGRRGTGGAAGDPTSTGGGDNSKLPGAGKVPDHSNGKGNAHGRDKDKQNNGNGNAYGHTKPHPVPKLPAVPKVPAVPNVPVLPKLPKAPKLPEVVGDKGSGKSQGNQNAAGEQRR